MKMYDTKYLKKVGHFGTFAGAQGQPRCNEEWIKDPYIDILGVALGTKPVSISILPKVTQNVVQQLKIAKERDVRFISISSFAPENNKNVAVYFRPANIRKAVLIALMHWCDPSPCSACESSYVIGKSFGYPDKDIEAYSAWDFIPERWGEMSDADRSSLWNSPHIVKKRVDNHARFSVEKKIMTPKWAAALKSKTVDAWITKLECDGAIKAVCV